MDAARCGRRTLLLGLASLAFATRAATVFDGSVVHVASARELTVRTDDGRRVTIVLTGTTLPRGRAGADAARRLLGEWLFGQRVRVMSWQDDGPPLAATLTTADGADVAMEMVSRGWLRADGTRATLVELERDARHARKGVWALGEP